MIRAPSISSWEVEAENHVQGQPVLIERPCLKKEGKKYRAFKNQGQWLLEETSVATLGLIESWGGMQGAVQLWSQPNISATSLSG